MDFGTLVTAGGLTTLLVEGLKLIWRRLIIKNPEYDFPTMFYVLVVPVSNALMPFLIKFLGLFTQDPILFMGWQDILKYLALVAVSSLISFVGYTDGLKPLKDYSRTL